MNRFPDWNPHTASPTKQQAAYRQLKTSIVSLDLPPGTIMAEPFIHERYGLSRTPMREAINRLYNEGFLSHIVGKGFIVNDIQYKDFQELYEVKEALESEAAYLCCVRKNNAIIDTIEKAYLAHRDSFLDSYDEKAILLDMDFHWAIITCANNKRIERQMSFVMDQNMKFFNMYYTVEFSRDVFEAFHEQHEAIFETIKGDEPEAARCAVLEHMRYVKDICQEYLFR